MANTKEVEWHFYENVLLEHEFSGFIVLDILKDGTLAGIEFIDLIEKEDYCFDF